jgi:hypothetical protein
MPSSALPACPNGFLDGGGRPFLPFAADFDASRITFLAAALDLAFAFLAFFFAICRPLSISCEARFAG